MKYRILPVIIVSFFFLHEKNYESSWEEPPLKQQIEMDTTLIPVGKGGLFVPSMYDPSLEPHFIVKKNGKFVSFGTNGSTLILEPGEYTLYIGSGPEENMMKIKVKIYDGKVTPVKPVWSTLVINVVNDKSVPFRGLYEIVSLPERKYIGMGFGAKVELGERVRAWILKPGTYMVLKVGENYQARKNFFTFPVRKGYLEKYTLVMNEETYDFMGAGQVDISETTKKVKNFLLSLVAGGDVLFNNKKNVIGQNPGNTFSFSFYFDFIMRYFLNKNYVYMRLKSDEGMTKQPDTDFQVVTDVVSFDGIYIYKIFKFLGPYLRFSADTSIFKGYMYWANPVDVEIGHFETNKETGENVWISEKVDKNVKQLKLSDNFYPLTLDGGVGINTDISISYFLDISMRIGTGFRKAFYNNVLRSVTVADSKNQTFTALHDYFLKGFEGAMIINARFSKYFTLNSEIETLFPFENLEKPVVDMYHNFGIRLSSFASLNYIIDFLYDPESLDKAQIEHRIMLRFSYKFF